MKLHLAFFILVICLAAGCKKEALVIVPAQETYAIPGDRFFPEGIAYNPKTGMFYTGSTNNGDIVQVDVQTGVTSLFASGAAQGRAFSTGMKLDYKGRLWVCGGNEGKIFVLSSDGALIKSWDVKASFGAAFVNDCIGDNDHMYFTDSQTPKMYRIKISDEPLGNAEEWLAFGQQIPYATGTNANGIEMTADGKYLIVVVSNSGKLYRIEKATKAISEIQLSSPVNSGDGLLLDGNTLYVSRNATGQIFPVILKENFSQGTVGTGFGTNLLFNTTLAKAGNYLLVVNGQLNRRPNANNPNPPAPVLPFSVSRVAIP
jgi:Cu-Zn family superoxide dismutase